MNKDSSCGFETRRIKKERHDNNIENGDMNEGRINNTLQNNDIIQDIITSKINNTCKNDKIRGFIEDAIGDESRKRVQDIYYKIEQLKIEEKLLLYLKLPCCLINGSGSVDPLRQPLNPLGNRYEIHQTIMWIKTHLEEDPDVSLPKQEVYDEYNIFCIRNSMKPLSTADFGKVMKQVYPRVRPRRLGTRGNSRYCYAGMRKRVKLDSPGLPSISDGQEMEEFDEPITEEMLGAASTLIREWAEGVLGMKFCSLSALARHLVDNMCVDTKSLAAICILSASSDLHPSPPKIPETPPSLSVTPVAGKPGKLREAQLQLAKKLQQREQIREQKTPIRIEGSTKLQQKSLKKQIKNSSSPNLTTTPKSTIHSSSTTSNRSRKLSRTNQQQQQQQQSSLQLNCDNNKHSINNDDIIINNDKNNRKRQIVDNFGDDTSSPEKQQKLKIDEKLNNNKQKITIIGPNILKQKNKKNGKTFVDNVLVKDEITMIDEQSLDKKLCTIDPDALDDYLNGGNNSQEPEEELLQYFQQSSSSSSDAEISIENSINSSSRSDKVSQLRLILQQNFKNTVEQIGTTSSTSVPQADDKIQALPTLLNNQNNKRRVSFETNVIEHVHQDGSTSNSTVVPQSPNTRRRIFNFTPISPGPLSPINVINGRTTSKPSSANASPFVSPRNTPVPRSRSTMPCRTTRPKQFSRSVSCSANYPGRLDETTFVVPTSGTCGTTTAPIGTATCSRTSDACSTSGGNFGSNLEVKGPLTNFLTTELNSQKQLLINYPSQENLQEIKNNYKKSKPTDQELSEYFNTIKPSTDNFCRSQSVPLHRMVNPTLMSPMSPYPLQYQLSASSTSSVAPTPVPSEFNDFGSTCLLDEVDANFIGDDQGFLIEDKDENITKILNFLDEDDDRNFNVQTNSILETTSENIDETILQPVITGIDDIQKIIDNPNYENDSGISGTTGVYTMPDDTNGGRTINQVYRESNEPMLSSPTLSSLNLTGDGGPGNDTRVGVSDLLETNFLDEHDAEEELDPLGNFEGSFQDVDALGPLFNEVGDGNR